MRERAWLLRIARNVSLDYLRSPRSRARDAASLEDLQAAGFEPEADRVLAAGKQPSGSVEQVVRQTQMATCVEEFVLSLPETLRTTLILHDVEGLINVEIAHVLDCSLAAAKMRLHRGRDQLREMMEEHCDLFRDGENVLKCLPHPPSTPTSAFVRGRVAES